MFPDGSEEMWIGWVPSLEYVRERWSDAPEDDIVLGTYLIAAVQQCSAFTGISDTDPIGENPELEERHCLAQVYQARALWRSGKAGNADQVGPDGFTVTVFPMDWTVKDLLRPKRPGSFYFGARS
jgi:hypothetical protein